MTDGSDGQSMKLAPSFNGSRSFLTNLEFESRLPDDHENGWLYRVVQRLLYFVSSCSILASVDPGFFYRLVVSLVTSILL